MIVHECLCVCVHACACMCACAHSLLSSVILLEHISLIIGQVLMMVWSLTSFDIILFKSFQDDGRVIMKGSFNEAQYSHEPNSPSSRI